MHPIFSAMCLITMYVRACEKWQLVTTKSDTKHALIIIRRTSSCTLTHEGIS